MSKFVDQCRKEWKRLGVPEAVAEEMAADLEADLAEAETEGASPEQVLGNAAFNPRTFAASWAAARGVSRRGARLLSGSAQFWGVLAGTAASLFVTLMGLVALGSGRASAVAVAVRRSVNLALPTPGTFRRFTQIGPVPGRVFAMGNGPLHVAGLFLLLLGLVGLGISTWLWLRWRPLASVRNGRDPQDGVSLPSYL